MFCFELIFCIRWGLGKDSFLLLLLPSPPPLLSSFPPLTSSSSFFCLWMFNCSSIICWKGVTVFFLMFQPEWSPELNQTMWFYSLNSSMASYYTKGTLTFPASSWVTFTHLPLCPNRPNFFSVPQTLQWRCTCLPFPLLRRFFCWLLMRLAPPDLWSLSS